MMNKIHLNKTEELVNALDEFQLEFVTSELEVTVRENQKTQSVSNTKRVENLIKQLRENSRLGLCVTVDTSTKDVEFIIDEI